MIIKLENIGALHILHALRYKYQNEIPVVLHNGPKYDYHLVTKKLNEEFEGQFEYLGVKPVNCITSSVPVEKDLENDKKMAGRTKLIGSVRFMVSSLLRVADNLAEGLRNSKCIDCKSCLE